MSIMSRPIGSVGEWRSWVWAVEAHMDAMLDEEALGELEERGDVAMPGLGRTARNAWFTGFSFSHYYGFYSLANTGLISGPV